MLSEHSTKVVAALEVFAGIIGYFGIFVIKKRFDYHNLLDAFGTYGLAGILG